jgi:hypothetical protein
MQAIVNIGLAFETLDETRRFGSKNVSQLLNILEADTSCVPVSFPFEIGLYNRENISELSTFSPSHFSASW